MSPLLKTILQGFLFAAQLCPYTVEAGFSTKLPPHKRYSSPFLTATTEKFLVDGAGFPHVPFDIGESYAGNLPISRPGAPAGAPGSNATDQQLWFWFFPSKNPAATDEILMWTNGGPGGASGSGVFGQNGQAPWRPGFSEATKNPWSHSRLTNMVYIDQPIGTGFTTGQVTAAGSAETAQQFLGFWRNFADTFGLNGKKVYVSGPSYAGQMVPYIASAMLDSDDINLQGMLIYDPAINDPVPQTEMPMLSFAEHWQNVFKLNSSFMDQIRREHAQAGYTDFYAEHFTFPPKGIMPPANNTGDFSRKIRTAIEDAMLLTEPCFNTQHITDTCPVLWSTTADNAWPYPAFKQMSIQDPDINPGDRGGYLNLTAVKNLVHAPPGHEWFLNSPNPSFTNPTNAPSGDSSPRSLLTVLPSVLERAPGMTLIANGQLDMSVPSNGTLFALQNATWRGAQGFSKYPSNTFMLPHTLLNASDTTGFWGDFLAVDGAGRSGEMGNWVFERGVGFVDVAFTGHALGRFNAGAVFRLLEVLLGRMSVEDGFGGSARWSVDISAPAPEYGP